MFPLVSTRRTRRSAGKALVVLVVAVFCIVYVPRISCQEAAQEQNVIASGQSDAVVTTASNGATLTTPTQPNSKQPPESEIIVEGLASYGHYRLLASGSGSHVYTAGFEYDRNSWGRLLGAQFDYTAEILPVILLDTAQAHDIYGSPTTSSRALVPGVGISPFGLRLMWFDKRALKPYLVFKFGMLAFTHKELSNRSTYENFTFQPGFGLQVKMNERVDLRLGLFSDFHFSNGFITPVDPGLDVMDANLGVSFHLDHKSRSSIR